MDTQRRRLTQVERAVSHATVPARPPSGWIRAIRSALGMTSRQLAARLGLSQSTLATLEKSEADDRITLRSLRKVADALDCDLQYVLVPRAPLTKRVEKRAEVVAHDRVSRILHTMRLEDQAPTDQVDQDDVSRVQKNLLDANWKQLWE
jgi:predicted DNA-binding mobile mystery protein A